MKAQFRDRAEAARGLVARLFDEKTTVVALPRGRVSIAAERAAMTGASRACINKQVLLERAESSVDGPPAGPVPPPGRWVDR